MNPPAAPAGGFGAAMLGIARQAWPVLISQWAGIAFGVLDTAMNCLLYTSPSPRD